MRIKACGWFWGMAESGAAMIDAFEEFGLKRSLVLEIEELQAIFRERGKTEHPDVGGDSGRFAQLQEALALIGPPSSRIRHWLELEGVEGELRGDLSSKLVDIFENISPKLQLADDLIRERERAGSQLAKALLEGRVQACRESLEEVQSELAEEIDQRVAGFEGVEAGEIDGWVVARDLAFLEKWQAQVRERFAGLW